MHYYKTLYRSPQLLALRIVLTPTSVRDPTFKRDLAAPATLLGITASEKYLMPIKWRLAEFQKVFLKTAMVPISDVIIIAQYITFVLSKTWFVLACDWTKLVTKTMLLCSCFLGNVGQNVQGHLWRQTAWICEKCRYSSRTPTEAGSRQSYYSRSQKGY